MGSLFKHELCYQMWSQKKNIKKRNAHKSFQKLYINYSQLQDICIAVCRALRPIGGFV